ncbi:MAG: hypothetical protein ACM3X6_07995 [Patescibacteria group bacterium]
MKRTFSLLCLVMTLFLTGCGPSAPPGPKVYTAGSYQDGTIFRACYWEGTVRHELPGDGVHEAQARDICLAGGEVYTAGYYKNGAVSTPCYWVGTTRHDLELGTGAIMGHASSIFVDGDGTVYTAGQYRSGTGDIVPCYWEGTERHDLSVTSSEAGAMDICIAGGVVYIAGYYKGATEDIACLWVDGVLTSLPLASLFEGEDAYAFSVFVDGGTVYLSGSHYSNTAHRSIPCYWVKTPETVAMYALSGVAETREDAAHAILVEDGVVYAAGAHYDSGIGQTIPCYWVVTEVGTAEGLERYDLAYGTGEPYATAKDISRTGGTIYAAGHYEDGSIDQACYWRGTERFDLPGGTNRSYAEAIFVQH